jgi:KamA family protein
MGRYYAITRDNIHHISQWRMLAPELQEAITVVSAVIPFRTNSYIIDQLIDWNRVPDDPLYTVTFPQATMLAEDDYLRVRGLVNSNSSPEQIELEANRIRRMLNPHPAGQATHNVPLVDGTMRYGMQHKYPQTVLFFPTEGQTCHANCTYCFRWPQFVKGTEAKFGSREVCELVDYIKRNPQVTDVLITGGDPLVMSAGVLSRYIRPLLAIESIDSIRIGTKAISFWPQRFVNDRDADDVLGLFAEIVAARKHVSVMAHVTHPRELSTPIAQEAIRRIRSTGAQIRMQSPVLRHVNDTPTAWADMWSSGVRLGCTPYYMFVARDTGTFRYFELPLVRAWEIFRNAYSTVSGLARTVRGPVMSTFPGKIQVLGLTEVHGTPAFILEFLHARDVNLVGRPFFGKCSPTATWFDQIEPLSPSDVPFFKHGTAQSNPP